MALLTPVPTRIRRFAIPAKNVYTRESGTTTLSAELVCPRCGSMQLTLFGFPGPILYGSDAGETFFSDPISISCKLCGHFEILFDAGGGDGYNAVIGATPQRSESPGVPQAWRLKGTQEVYRVEVYVTYDDDAHDAIQEGEVYDDAFSSIAFLCIDEQGKKHDVTWFETA